MRNFLKCKQQHKFKVKFSKEDKMRELLCYQTQVWCSFLKNYMAQTSQLLPLNSFSQDKNFANFLPANCTKVQLQKDNTSKSNIFLDINIFQFDILSNIKVLQDGQLGEHSKKELNNYCSFSGTHSLHHNKYMYQFC